MPYITSAERRGLEKGLERGREEGATAVARRMKRRGMEVEDIMELTGLSRDIVEKLDPEESAES